MNDPLPPDTRTCRERQDEAIAELPLIIRSKLFIDLEITNEVNDLRNRVAALKAQLVRVPILGELRSDRKPPTPEAQP